MHTNEPSTRRNVLVVGIHAPNRCQLRPIQSIACLLLDLNQCGLPSIWSIHIAPRTGRIGLKTVSCTPNAEIPGNQTGLRDSLYHSTTHTFSTYDNDPTSGGVPKADRHGSRTSLNAITVKKEEARPARTSPKKMLLITTVWPLAINSSSQHTERGGWRVSVITGICTSCRHIAEATHSTL
jgi:hypothetical protein